MGAFLGSCLGSCGAGILCGACRECKPAKRGPMSRIPYLFLLLVSGLFGVVLSLYGERHWNLGVSSADCSGCAGNGSVFRLSFCLLLFEAMHVLLIAGGAQAFHYSWFAPKCLVYVGAVVLCFWLGSDGTFDGYAEVSRYSLSPLYLLIQIVLLITWAYDLNEAILAKADPSTETEAGAEHSEDRDEDERESAPAWYWLLFLTSFALYGACFVLLGFFYEWYGGSECDTHEGVISVTIAFVALNLLLTVCASGSSAPLRHILTSAIVSIYSVFLVYAGMQADNKDACNQFADSRNTSTLWIGICFSLLGLAYAGLRNDLPSVFWESDPSDFETPLLSADGTAANSDSNYSEEASDQMAADSNYDDLEQGKDKKSSGKRERRASSDGSQTSVVLTVSDKKDAVCFHAIMFLAAAYMSMLLTNWDSNSANRSTENATGRGTFWANTSCMFVNQLLFFWTLLAPLLCAERFQQHEE